MTEPVYITPAITPESAHQFAYTNRALFEGKPRGIVLNFHGLSATALRNEPNELDTFCAENHLLCIYPYYGPWSWMNRESVRYVDDVVDAFITREGLDANVNIISTGGSMGGLSSLIYARYARRTPNACFANCPVCDLPYHAGERPDLPRSIYLAFAHYECGLDEAMRLHSPLHQAQHLPHIPYYIVHGSADAAVNKEMHSDRLVRIMRKAGYDLIYREVEGMTHCALGNFPEENQAWMEAIREAAVK